MLHGYWRGPVVTTTGVPCRDDKAVQRPAPLLAGEPLWFLDAEGLAPTRGVAAADAGGSGATGGRSGYADQA